MKYVGNISKGNTTQNPQTDKWLPCQLWEILYMNMNAIEDMLF